jgi:pyruvate/2-oxoglutarate dehydrogenase complex dihydrolipoamide acyltransferase (E2) component
MASKIIMPKQGLQMTEGTIIKWLVKEGGKVVKDEPLFEMETDKLTITIEAMEGGTMLKIVRGEGETVPITETIAIVGEPGEDISSLLPSSASAAPAAETTAAAGFR